MAKLTIKGKEYPFELTAKGKLNIEGSKIDLQKVLSTDFECMRFAYEVVKGACSFNGVEIDFKHDDFMDGVELGVFEKARTLAKTLLPGSDSDSEATTTASEKTTKK